MKQTHVALLLAGALSLSLLAACGAAPSSDPSPTPDVTQQVSPSPETSTAPQLSPSPAVSPSPLPEETPVATLSLSHSDVTLKKAGGAFVLKATLSGVQGKLIYTSSDESVATVNDAGKVTAVAPGSATITVTAQEDAQLTAACVVRCTWSAAATPKPEATPAPSQKPTASVDLTAFYKDMTGQYSFQSLQAMTGEMLDNFYPGMSAVSTKQQLIMGTMLSMNNGEFCLVEVSDSKDVSTVKSIFQARVDYMVDGGAWYPEPTEQWTRNSRVVANGNYVMMVVNEQCDSIVSAFNKLF